MNPDGILVLSAVILDQWQERLQPVYRLKGSRWRTCSRDLALKKHNGKCRISILSPAYEPKLNKTFIYSLEHTDEDLKVPENLRVWSLPLTFNGCTMTFVEGPLFLFSSILSPVCKHYNLWDRQLIWYEDEQSSCNRSWCAPTFIVFKSLKMITFLTLKLESFSTEVLTSIRKLDEAIWFVAKENQFLLLLCPSIHALQSDCHDNLPMFGADLKTFFVKFGGLQ